MSRAFRLAMTGDKQLDHKLKAIAAQEGARSINAEMRKSTRDAVRRIVLPAVQQQVPVATGLLKSQLAVRAIRRSRSKLGTAVGFRDPLFKGETFYGGFHEFGWKTRSGSDVPPDRFLRGPLYDNASHIRSHVISRLRSWVAARNR